MIKSPYQPLPYTISPARGQALLSFQGRRMPDHLPLFETAKIEEVRPAPNDQLPGLAQTAPASGPNLLLHGDCLSACAYLKANNIKVDLVYIDPPFASGANYAKKIYLRNGKNGTNGNSAKIEGGVAIGEEIMYGDIWQKEDYLNWLYERLLGIRQVMSENGSIYVHLDWHIGHYVKVLLDEVFGEDCFRNEVVWHYSGWNKKLSRNFNRRWESLLFYSQGDDPVFNSFSMPWISREEYIKARKQEVHRDAQGREYVLSDAGGGKRVERLIEEAMAMGRPVDDVWDIDKINNSALEDRDYTTQKPEQLLERIIKASTNEGMTVADFFSGSGTATIAACKLARRFIACDIGLNAIQTTRDGLASAGASFDILKIQDGVRLFRNPAQTMAKIFSLVDGFKKREELELGEFWDGGLPGQSGRYIPLKFVGLHERLTPALLDVYLEEIYQLEANDRADGVRILYAHRDLEADQEYVDKRLRESGKTLLKVELISLNQLLERKASSLFTPDSAIVEVKPSGKGKWEVVIKKFFSPYLKAKVDEFNAKRGKGAANTLFDESDKDGENANGDEDPGKKAAPHSAPFKPVVISEEGLELIEAVQFDTTLRVDGVWISNPALEDKAGPKQKVKGRYLLPTESFRIKFRNIAGDEMVWDSTGG